MHLIWSLSRSIVSHFKRATRRFSSCHALLQHFNVILPSLCDFTPFWVNSIRSDRGKSIVRQDAVAAREHHTVTRALDIALHHFLTIAEVFLGHMSILDCAALLTVNITEVVNGFTRTQSWQGAYAAPWNYTPMWNIVTGRSIKEGIGICISFKVFPAAITISFLVYTRWWSNVVIDLRDGCLMAGMISVRILRQRKNCRSGLFWLRCNQFWCFLSDINFLNTESIWGSLCETNGQRLLWNWVFGFGTSVNSCVIVAILASEGTSTATTISGSWPIKWRVREDASVARERHSCLIHFDRKWYFRIID